MELNKIYKMDALEFLRSLPDNSVDLVLTDPPYRFQTQGGKMAQERSYLKDGMAKIGSGAEYDIYNEGFIEELIRVSKKPNIFLFCNKAQIFDILKKAEELNLNFEIVVFCKKAPTPLTNNQWLPDKEYGIHLFKNIEVKGAYNTKRSFFVENTFKDTSIAHPTAKPLHIIETLINNMSKEKEVILDPFMGSGTTAVAARNLDRNFIGSELQQEYIDIAENRLKLIQKRLF